SAASLPTDGWWRSSSSRSILGSWGPSSVRNSSRGLAGPTRCIGIALGRAQGRPRLPRRRTSTTNAQYRSEAFSRSSRRTMDPVRAHHGHREGGRVHFPDLMPLADALPRLLDQIPVLDVEERPLLNAVGQTLAEDVVSTENVPPFPNSGMDGFAVRAVDTPGELRVVADQAAGHVTDVAVSRGTAIRIMTGAALPEGADAVVPVEDTDGSSGGSVRIHSSAAAGANVRQAGEDVRAGQLALPSGSLLSPAAIGLLASIGRPRV